MMFKKGDLVFNKVNKKYGSITEIIAHTNLVNVKYEDGDWDLEDATDLMLDTRYQSIMPNHYSGGITFTLPDDYEAFGWDVATSNDSSIGTTFEALSKLPRYCNHQWKNDSYFSAKVYTTCAKCGAKKEDEWK